MAEENGWLRLDRNIINCAAWLQGSDVQRTLMIILLAKAAWKPTEGLWKGKLITLNPGQLLITITELTQLTNSTRQAVRTAINRLETCNFATIESTKKGLLITLISWGKYQGSQATNNQTNNHQSTNEPQKCNHQSTIEQPSINQQTDPHNMYKNPNKEQGTKNKGNKEQETLPYSTLQILKDFEQSHQSRELTEALVEWVKMRAVNGNGTNPNSFNEQLDRLVLLCEGKRDKAIAIVKQSTAKHWAQFWELKTPGAPVAPKRTKPTPTSPSPKQPTPPTPPASQAPTATQPAQPTYGGMLYPGSIPPGHRIFQPGDELNGAPPPKPEDFPGDPTGWQRAMNAWTRSQGTENQAITKRFGPEPDEAERNRILQAMGQRKDE